MISVGELKELIYRESGYKIQVHDNDPILATFYVNLATLGVALKHAEDIQEKAKITIESLPGAADAEMKRAGREAISSLSQEVGRIARRIVGDTVAHERQKSLAIAVGAVALGSVFFFASGAMLAKASIGMTAALVGAMVIGSLGGGVLCFSLMARSESAVQAMVGEKASAAIGAEWTYSRFLTARLKANLSDRVLLAAQDVLVNGLQVEEAATRRQIDAGQVTRGIHELSKY